MNETPRLRFGLAGKRFMGKQMETGGSLRYEFHGRSCRWRRLLLVFTNGNAQRGLKSVAETENKRNKN